MLSLIAAGCVGAGLLAGGKALYTKASRKAIVVEQVAEPRIVSAVATMASVKYDRVLAKQIEQAMSDAVMEAVAGGVSLEDTATIRAATMAARMKVLEQARGL